VSLEEKIAFFGVFPVFLALGWLLVPQVWRGRRDAYDDAPIVHAFMGEGGRHGFNAFIPAVFASATVLYAAVMLEVVYDVVVDEAVAAWHAAAGMAYLGSLLIMLVAFNLLLFMRPRFLAPRHLRDERGWATAAADSWRARRRQQSR
jgi:hypothetical protein